jgi:NSS family neurotransmitter:Na+ symporter
VTCIFVGWIVKPKTLIDEVRLSSPFRFAKVWTVIIKYVAPVFMVIILVSYVAQTFGLVNF